MFKPSIFLISLILCVFYLHGLSQEIDFEQLVRLQDESFIEINDELVKKGFEFSSSSPGSENNYSKVVWAYNKNTLDKATEWFSLFYGNGHDNILFYQIHDKELYSRIKGQINAANMKEISSGIDENEIYSIYEGQNYVVKFNIETKNSDNTIYHITLFERDTYHAIQESIRQEEYDKILEELDAKWVKEEEAQRKKVEAEKQMQAKIEYEREMEQKGYTKIKVGGFMYNENLKQIKKVTSNTYAKILNKSTNHSGYYYIEYKGVRGYVLKQCFSVW